MNIFVIYQTNEVSNNIFCDSLIYALLGATPGGSRAPLGRGKVTNADGLFYVWLVFIYC